MARSYPLTKLLYASLLMSTAALSGTTFAAVNKDEYELQERCGKHAADYFRRNFGNAVSKIEGGQQEIDFSNHFSKRLNKCFIQITTNNVRYKNKNPEVVTSFDIRVLDLNANREYARYVNVYQKEKPALCRVAEKWCNGILEWEALIKPYMED